MWNDTDIYDEETGTFYGYGEDEYTCPHGKYIGTPGGPDILCGWCEEGISREDYMAAMRSQRLHGIRDKAYWYAMHYMVDGAWDTYSLIPGRSGKDANGESSLVHWMNAIKDEIEAMSDDDLILIENDVYRGYRH